MAFELRTFNNDIAIVGKLTIRDVFELGFSNTAGTDREVQAIGSGANINIKLVPKGTGKVTVPTGYATGVTDDSLINKVYADTHLLAKEASAILLAPTVTENNYAIVWDNTATKFTLAATASGVTYGSGLENVAGVIKLGTTPLDRPTDIIGAQILSLGTSGSKLTQLLGNTTGKIELIGGTNVSKLTLNGTSPIILEGGAALSSIIFDAAGAITLTDNQGGAGQRGLRGASDYAANITALDYTQKGYVDIKIGGKNVSVLINNPTVTQHGYAITWDNSNLVYTLSPVAGGANTYDALTDTPANKTGQALKFVRVNSGETGHEYVTLEDYISTPSDEYFVADGVEDTFILSEPNDLAIMLVEVGGIVQRRGVNYSKDDASKQVVFVSPPIAGQSIGVFYITDLLGGGGATRSTFVEWDATGDTIPIDADGIGSGVSGVILAGDQFYFGVGGGNLDAGLGVEFFPANTIITAKQNSPTLSTHYIYKA